MAERLTERLAEALAQVIEYENRVAALNAALEADGDDFDTAKFISMRLADRERKLAQHEEVLGVAVRRWQDRKLEQARNGGEDKP